MQLSPLKYHSCYKSIIEESTKNETKIQFKERKKKKTLARWKKNMSIKTVTEIHLFQRAPDISIIKKAPNVI